MINQNYLFHILVTNTDSSLSTALAVTYPPNNWIGSLTGFLIFFFHFFVIVFFSTVYKEHLKH